MTQPKYCLTNAGPGILVNDSDLVQSPKLKEGFEKSLKAEPFLNNPKVYTVSMSRLEFDSMNKMLVDTKDPAVMQWAGYGLSKQYIHDNPTLSLWPKQPYGIIVFYNGTSYQLSADYEGIRPLGQGD